MHIYTPAVRMVKSFHRSLHLTLMLVAGGLLADDPNTLYRQELQPFPIPIVVPATIAGRNYAFYFDTGSTNIVFDKSLTNLVSGPGQKTNARIIGKVVSIETFESPSISVGEWRLADTKAGILDLSFVRQADGRNITGLLGLESYKPYYVWLDFENSELKILKRLPAQASGMQAIDMNRSNTGSLHPLACPRFLIHSL